MCLCVSAGPAVKPSVSLLPPSSLQISGESAALLCLLSSYSPKGARVSWTLDGSEVTGGSDQQESEGRTLQPQQRPEPQQSTLGRRKALRLQSNT